MLLFEGRLAPGPFSSCSTGSGIDPWLISAPGLVPRIRFPTDRLSAQGPPRLAKSMSAVGSEAEAAPAIEYFETLQRPHNSSRVRAADFHTKEKGRSVPAPKFHPGTSPQEYSGFLASKDVRRPWHPTLPSSASESECSVTIVNRRLGGANGVFPFRVCDGRFRVT